MSGLSDLNFGDFSEQQAQPETSSQNEAPISRTEEVKAFFADEEAKRNQWDASRERLQRGIDQWIGVPQAGVPAGYIAPKKNHIKVLLCTLHQILWKGNTWQIIGMDKMSDPNQVKKFYRKAMMMCHPDKINQNDEDHDKIYIANQCFAALNDAFNEYKNEPGVNIS
jgi:hypothetical protein